MTSPATVYIPLDQLRFGHEATPPINARKTGRDAEIEAYAASIAAHGMQYPLIFKEIGGEKFVSDGNKRLAAWRLRIERGEIPADHEVKCEPLSDDAKPLEMSLVLNIERAPLHEADQYETFHLLHADGMSGDDIASRFGIEKGRVSRILAIGKLSPMILDAWRNDEFDRNPIEIIRAFTLAPSIEEQEKVFKRLKKEGRLMGWIVREALGAGNREANKNLAFVGKDVYRDAGGGLVEDLFSSNDSVIGDPELLANLAREKLQAKCAELVEDGWSWAETEENLPKEWGWNWSRIDVSKKKATKADKAKSGAVVRIDHEGKLLINYGVVKPDGKKAKSTKADKDGNAGDKPEISNALAQRLSESATMATRDALSEEPRLGLIALLAGLLTRYAHESPVRARIDGMTPMNPSEMEDFETVFARLQQMDDAGLFRAAAAVAAMALDLRVYNAQRLPFGGESGLLADAINSETMKEMLGRNFDAQDYFSSAAKPLVLRAIEESINADEAKKAGKLKKAELVDYAMTNVVETGWLPPELRTANYDGPAGVEMKEAAE